MNEELESSLKSAKRGQAGLSLSRFWGRGSFDDLEKKGKERRSSKAKGRKKKGKIGKKKEKGSSRGAGRL